MTPRSLLPAALLLLAAWCASLPSGPAAFAEQIVEKDDEGRTTAKYSLDDEGRRNGAYAEFHSDGSIKLKATYRHGRLDGRYVSYHPGGRPHVTATYVDGELDGKYVEKDRRGRFVIRTAYVKGRRDGTYEEWKDGEPLSQQRWEAGVPVDVDGVRPFGKSRDDIRHGIEEIFNSKDPLEENADDPEARGRGECLRHLAIFRFLCDLPYADLELDAQLNTYADAGAALCERIGHLDHTPENPGMPESEYQFGYHGTSHSNLYMGAEDIVAQVRAYMDDSDPSNIDAVGHRRWCLNPPLQKVGFGRSGRFGGMMCQDRSRKDVPDTEFVAFPPRGWMPSYWFGPRYAWSVSLSRKHFDAPDPARVKVTITPLADDDYVRRAEPLALDHLKVNTSGAGMPWCIIFRAAEIDTEPGARYWVEVTGLTHRGEPAPLRYVSAFFEL